MDNTETSRKLRKPVLTHVIDPRLSKNYKNYLLQSLIATGLCCIMLISLDYIIPGAIVASLGASTFVVFAGPHTKSAGPRCLLGGHLIGTGTGMISWQLLHWGLLSSVLTSRMEMVFFASIAVGLAVFIMVVIDMEHPPAAGTALALVIEEWSIYTIAFIGGASLFLTLARLIVGRRMKNLF